MSSSKKHDIYIEQTFMGNEYRIYSDLYPWQIKQIEGVIKVSNLMQDGGYLLVIIDKRYHQKRVLADIKRLVKSA